MTEPDLARLRLGQDAEVVTDDGQTRKGRLSFVASRAEFTPKNVQTRDERVKLVYRHQGRPRERGRPLQARDARHRAPPSGGAAGRDERGADGHARAGAARSPAASGRSGPSTDVAFDVRRGEMFGLIGPDGAGKTTTLRMVLGLLRPDSGQVRTCGLDPLRQRRRLSSRVGYLSQRFSLYGDLTVDENVAFFAEIHDVRDYAPRRDALLEMVRMTAFRDRLADRLSGGMKQKLALVCTLVHTPELLVLDEPTTGVDPVSRRDFWKLLARLQREGLTILLTTPYLDEAERCTRVALVDHGRLLTVDAPDALRAAEPGVMVEVVAEPRREAVATLRERARGERRSRSSASGSTRRSPPGAGPRPRPRPWPRSCARRASSALRPTHTPSLEDVFIGRIRARDAAAAQR